MAITTQDRPVEPIQWTYPYDPTRNQNQMRFHQVIAKEKLFGGAAGGGKGMRCPDRDSPSYDQDSETKVATPKGWALAGDLRIGQQVCNPDGTTAKIIGIYDRGPKQFYRITLADGSTVEADEDHLWAISIAGIRRRRKIAPPTIPEGLRAEDEWNLRVQSRCVLVNTRELRELCLSAADEKAQGLRPHYVQLPLTNPVQMTYPKGNGERFSPYILGVLVGDGSCSGDTIRAHFLDSEIADRISQELPNNLKLLRPSENKIDHFFRLKNQKIGPSPVTILKRDRLHGCRSWEKFIPDRIKYGTIDTRFAFIQGLFDTDGYMDERGHVEFVTVSEQLAKDTQQVLRSLGMYATLSTKIPSYTYNGDKKQGRVAYRLYVKGRNMERLFNLERKRNRAKKFNGGDVHPWHRVISVEPTVIDNSRCIQVDNLNHLYLTDDYIVTHNTDGMLAELLSVVLQYGVPGLILRRTTTAMTAIRERLLERIPPEVGKFSDQKGIWRFRNGGTLTLAYLENNAHIDRYVGNEFFLIAWDELTQFTEYQYKRMFHPLRISKKHPSYELLKKAGLSPYYISGTNPGGIGHGWVKARFIDPAPPYTLWQPRSTPEEPKPGTRIFVPSLLSDNPYLDDEYLANLQAMDEEERRMLITGDWDVYKGQYFSEFRRNIHVVKPEDYPLTLGGTRRLMGIDFGVSNPFAALWGALLADNQLLIYRELYQADLTASEQAKLILASEMPGERLSSRPIPTYLDPACWQREANSPAPSRPGVAPRESAAWHYQQAGLPVRKADNRRKEGWQELKRRLRINPKTSKPGILIYDTCVNLIRTLPDLPRDKNDPEDVDTHAEDHCFIAGTLIATENGATPIEKIKLGQRVWTREGLKFVVRSGLTNKNAQVLRLELSNGQSITCTPNHPFFTENRGWIDAEDLTQSDILSSWTTLKLSRQQFKSSEASVSTYAGITSNTKANGYINMYGSHLTDQFLRIVTSITSTMTGLITESRISNSSPKRRIFNTTAKSPAPRRKPLLDITLRILRHLRTCFSVKNSDPMLLNVDGKKQSPGNTSVMSAAKDTNLSRSGALNSVPTIANQHLDATLESTTKFGNALFASNHSNAINTVSQNAAPVHVVAKHRVEQRQPVYNLTVLGEPEYFANGILVHNCPDALRYLCMAAPRMPIHESLVRDELRKMAKNPTLSSRNVSGRMT